VIRCSKQKWWLISAPDHYPEIGFERTLGRVILEIIALSGREVTLSDESKEVFSARFRKDCRIATIGTAGTDRIFITDFSSRGVPLAHHRTSDLREVARAVESWLMDELNLREMKQRLTNLFVSEVSFETEAGRGVAARWNLLLSPHDDEPTLTSLLGPEFRALVRAAASRPLLRQLVPVVSMGFYLSFSRTIGYPFAMAGDCAVWAADNRCGFFKRGGYAPAEGTVEEMLDLVERSLPPDVGPAIFGTAEDLIA
jgi:hypothetical protein